MGLVLLACLFKVNAQEPPVEPAHPDVVPLANWDVVPRANRSAAAPTRLVTARRDPVPVYPDARTKVELPGASYEVWRSRSGAEIGLGVNAPGARLPSRDGQRAVYAAVPTVGMVVRYRVSDNYAVFADTAGVRGVNVDTALASYPTKVGVEWQPAKSTFGLDKGALGIRLDSGYKLSMKVRRSGASVYLRGQF